MNILFVNYEYPPLGGGGGVFTRTLARELANRGHKIYVVTTNANMPKVEEDLGITIRRVNCFRSTLTWTPKLPMYLFPPSSLKPIYDITKRNRIELINTHFAIPSGVSPAIISKVKKTPLITNIMGADLYDPTKYGRQRPLLDMIAKAVLNRSELLICPSLDMKMRAERLTTTPIEIIPYGIDPYKFITECNRGVQIRKRFGIEEEDFVILTVARLIPRKSFHTALEVIREVKKDVRDIKYVLVGEGPEKERILKAVKELALDDTVILSGRVADRELPSYYAMADLFLMASLHEAFGIVLLEAMASGLPVVVSDVGGMQDIVENGKSGYLCPLGDVSAFADKIKLLLADDSIRKRQGEFGRRSVLDNFTQERITDRYEDVFGGAISGFEKR